MSKSNETETVRTTRAQVRDAAGELWFVLAPMTLFGLVAGVIGMVAGSLLFEQTWVAAVAALVCMVMTAIPIMFDRLERAAAMEVGA